MGGVDPPALQACCGVAGQAPLAGESLQAERHRDGSWKSQLVGTKAASLTGFGGAPQHLL